MAGNKQDGLPDEDEVRAAGGDDDEVELQIVDDTPAEDRGRTPLSKEKLEGLEPSQEELDSYSEKTKKRILQLQHAYHDQRRAAEQAQRERDAAEQYARAAAEQRRTIEQRYVAGEKVFVEGMRGKADTEIKAAEAELKAATEAFDAEKMIEAQKKLTKAMMEQQTYQNWQVSKPPSQDDASVVQTRHNEPQRSPQVPQPDARARAWAAKNRWFEVDKAMTGFAYGVDAELAAEGITAADDPDTYYGEIDRRLREVFPDKFEKQADREPERNARNQQEPTRTPVAPVRRSSSGKRVVTLTRTQEAMAKKLGLTPQQYAVEVAKLEAHNG